MGRRAKPAKGKAEAKRPAARTSPKADSAKALDLGKRLAEALKREANALEQQAATTEILRIISNSPTDVQPVFDTIAASASRLCGGVAAIVTRFDGEMIHLVAHHNPRPGIVPGAAGLYPRRPSRDTTTARAIPHRARESGSGVRGVPPGRHGGQEGGGHGVGVGAVTEVHRAARRPHLGQEPGRDGLDIHVHDPGAPLAERLRRRRPYTNLMTPLSHSH